MARILVVDDYPETAELIAQLLARAGYETAFARNAEEALAVCRGQRFDLLVSDIHMPGKSGWELLRELLAQRRIPAIAISGHVQSRDQALSRAAGFAMHLNKPIDLDTLVESVRAILGRGVGLAEDAPLS